jgi:hypothetical protein
MGVPAADQVVERTDIVGHEPAQQAGAARIHDRTLASPRNEGLQLSVTAL